MKQNDDENVDAYYNRFNYSKQNMESSIGGTIQLTKYVERMDGYDAECTKTTQQLKKVAYDRLMSVVYLENSNQPNFRQCNTNIHNIQTMTNSQYPSTIRDANIILKKISNENRMIKKSNIVLMNTTLEVEKKSIVMNDESESPISVKINPTNTTIIAPVTKDNIITTELEKETKFTKEPLRKSTTRNNNGNLTLWGWEICMNEWDRQWVKGFVQTLAKKYKNMETNCMVKWFKRNDENHIVLPQSFITKKRMNCIRLVTENVLKKINIDGNFDSDNVYAIFSLQGMKKEKFIHHTLEPKKITIIHSMSKRRIEVINKKEETESFQLEKGEILILDGNTKISRSSIEKTDKAVEIQVSIGYIGYKAWPNYNEMGLKEQNP